MLTDYANKLYADFKFPVSKLTDLHEVNTIIKECRISRDHVWLMPICHDAVSHELAAPLVAEWCKGEGYNFSPRLQLVLWDRATGV